MKSRLICLPVILFLFFSTYSHAQVNTKNANGSYNPNGYKEWKSSEDLKRNQKSYDDALEKNKQVAPVKKRSSSALYEPTQSPEDIAKNNTCLSGNCKDGYGTWQGTPYTVYKYVGEFRNGEMSGRGKMYDWEGYLLFDGTVDKGNTVGKTTTYWQEKAFGDGSIGYYNISLKNVFEGTLINNKKQGSGTLYEYDENEKLVSIYEGYYKDNKRNGDGKLMMFYGGKNVGDYYTGIWKDDKREGKGVEKVNQGSYVGEFKNDQRNGEGVSFLIELRTDTLIVQYVGNWKDGKRDGLGTDYDKNGTMVYEGNFNAGKRHGAGKFYAANNKVSEGIWVDGVNKEIDPYSVPEAEFILKEINENFNNNNANKWETYSFKELKKGSYTIRGFTSGKALVPGKISFEAKDDWMYEASMRKVSGVVSAQFGIGWDGAEFLLHSLGMASFSSGSSAPGSAVSLVDCKVKKGSNTLRVSKKGLSIEASVNGKTIYTGKAENISSKNLYLLLVGKDSNDNKFLVEFTDVIFKRL